MRASCARTSSEAMLEEAEEISCGADGGLHAPQNPSHATRWVLCLVPAGPAAHQQIANGSRAAYRYAEARRRAHASLGVARPYPRLPRT